MKRLIAGFLSVCVAVSLLMTGCSSGGTDNTAQTDGPVTITIWHDKEDEVAQALQTELDTLAPDIVVKLEKKDGLTDSLKMVGNDPNSAPDMYFFAHDKIGVYAEMGILAPITDFIDKSTLDQYIPMTIEAATYKGEVYQLPIYFETLLYMYNRRYMSDDEVPSTTEELYKYMQENTKGGHYGFVEQHSTAYYAAGWLHAFGGYILNENGEPGLDDENTIKALEYHKKFVELMPTEGEYSTVNTLFREGKAHSTIGGPWLVPTARESGIDLGIAPMPTVDETGNKIAPYSGVQGIRAIATSIGISLLNLVTLRRLRTSSPTVTSFPKILRLLMKPLSSSPTFPPTVKQRRFPWTQAGSCLRFRTRISSLSTKKRLLRQIVKRSLRALITL